MGDEYYDRYRSLSHDELFRQLKQGSPGQIESLAGIWRVVEETVGGLATALRHELENLPPRWTSDGGHVYQYRVGLIAGWADTLAAEAVNIRTGLSVMSGALAEAQRQAEPTQVEATEWAFDGLVGPALGRTTTEAQTSSAHDRMVTLVADLAAGYGVTETQTFPTNPPPPPADLPGAPVPDGPPAYSAGAGLAAAGSAPLAHARPQSGPETHSDGLIGTRLAATAGPPPGAAQAAHPVSMLAGAVTSLAAAPSHLIGPTVGGLDAREVHDGGARATSAPPPVAGMGGMMAQPALGDSAPVDGMATSWSAAGRPFWADDEEEEEPPPPVIT